MLRLYTKIGCPDSKRLKGKLRKANVPFKEVRIKKKGEPPPELKALGWTGRVPFAVPTLEEPGIAEEALLVNFLQVLRQISARTEA